ncbi:MAG: F0F1 ATP synthase subunit B [Selenomonadaceae bacterium]|nr:F0F1 ATP synthase subunit B [Selenomonadaceae bacterium]
MVAQVLNFLILAAILRALAYKPVARMLQQRSDKIRETIDKADADKKAAEETLRQYKSQLADAQRRAQEIVDKAELTARQEREVLVAETKKEIDRMKQNAQAEIENERNRAFEQMKAEIVSLSLAAAEKIVEKNLTSKENDKLVGDFISGLDKDMFDEAK